jgi:outer membrane protein assembly factor BamA
LRVASVGFTGTPDVPENELRARLKLTAGKEFDFFRWQEDRDRLEESLRQDNHFEARVAAHRSTPQGTAEAVDLIYDVYRGPRTIVDLVGIPNDRSLRAELERVWNQAVFDGLLLDQAKDAAGAALVRDGYLRATVTTSINQPEGSQEKHLVVTVERGARYASPGLAFSGHQHVSTARLEELARSSESPWIDPTPLVQAITTMYRNEGFLDAGVSVGPPRFTEASATLPIVVREGPQFRLASVTFTGPRARTAADVAQTFGLKPGAPLTREAADTAVQNLASSYRADGFNTVRVTLTNEAMRDRGLVALTVNVDEGPRQVVRDITIEGTRRTRPTVVTEALEIERGQPVDLAAWARARKRLFDTGVFSRVDIQAVPIEPGDTPAREPGAQPVEGEQPIRARVTLEEFPSLRVRYGFEVNDELQPASETRTLRPGVAARATYRNVFGRAATSQLALRYSKDFEAARGFFSTPSFFNLPLTSNLFLERSREQLPNSLFVADRVGFTAEQQVRPWRRLQVFYSYGFERNHTFDPNADPNDDDAFDLTINVARLAATALVDTRNDLFDATRGQRFSSTFEYGVAPLGSDLRFGKYFLQQDYYRPLGHGLVSATSGRLGLAAGYGQELFQEERFFAGGGNSVRGYEQDALGPVDVFGDPAGGNALLVFNQEIRFPIAWRFRGVGFFDAGNVFPKIGDLGFGGLRAGTGVGLRVDTPYALLRIDLGTPLNPQPGEARAQWFFSIGQSF